MGWGFLLCISLTLFFNPAYSIAQTIDPPSIPTAANPKDHFDNAEKFFYREVSWWKNKSDDYKDAASEYREFIEQYPTGPSIDIQLLFYAKVQLAESYFRINQEPDRITDYMEIALKNFESLQDELTDEFTGTLPEYEQLRTRYLENIRSRIYSCHIFFAQVHLHVADFYLNQAKGLIPIFNPDPKKLNAALYRYQTGYTRALLAAPRSNTAMEAIFGIIVTYDLLGDKNNALTMIDTLEREYPEHPYRKEIEKIRSSLFH